MSGAVPRRVAALLPLLGVVLLGLTACSGRSPGAASSSGPPAHDLLSLAPTTAPAAGPAGTITWALYRDITGLDPATAFDYPENTVVATLCDALQRQQPDGSVGPGLATASYQTPTRLVLTLRADVHFWDGRPLTPADVVFSLKRNLSPAVGGFYANVFDRVAAITATGPHQVTLELKQPDYWLVGELSAMPGVVIEQRYAQAKGHDYGTPAGGVMCTGPFEFRSWVPGRAVTVTRNPHYWDPGLQARSQQIDFVGVSDAAALTSGLATGAIDGSYLTDTSNLGQLQQTPGVRVYLGPSFDTEYFIPSNLHGPLGDVRVRRALSMAFDRAAYIQTVYAGDALVPRLSANPGTWGFARGVFSTAWNAAPPATLDLAAARQLVRQAGDTGRTIVIGTSTGLSTVETEAEAWRSAAQSIGLKVQLYNVSPANYINFFTDPNARKHVDAFSTTTYGDYADPAALDATYVLPDGSQDYSGYQNPAITAALDRARAAADPTQRARDDVAAEQLIMQQLPWIPVADPANFLVLNSHLTGAPTSFAYMQGPWLAGVGAVHGG